MKVGDLVILSAKGRALQMNWQIVECGGYGMVVKKDNKKIVSVRWFKSDGSPFCGFKNDKPRNFFRYELKYLSKKFKKKLNKS